MAWAYWGIALLLGSWALIRALRVRAQRRLSDALGEIYVALQRGLPGYRIGAIADGMVEIAGPAGQTLRVSLARMLALFQARGQDLPARRRALDEVVRAARERAEAELADATAGDQRREAPTGN